MLDYRAWIAAGLILISAGGAYLYWLHRTRTFYTARSLTAPRPDSGSDSKQPSKPVTETLHIDGCVKGFEVLPGRTLEPRVVPGASKEVVRGIYGTESERDKIGLLTWKLEAFTLIADDYGPDKSSNAVSITMKPGHVFMTPDGIDLGLDSFASVLHKMSDRKVDVSESIEGADGTWILTLSFYSFCNRKFRSEYKWLLDGSPDNDRQILPPANDPSAPLRSSIFTNKIVYDYALVMANGSDKAVRGQPSTH